MLPGDEPLRRSREELSMNAALSNGKTSIQRLVERHQPGFGLEQDFYLSPEVFALDIERVYFRHWLFAGHIDQVRKPGDYFLYQIAGESIILIRGDDGDVRGFYNVCRHRGSRICLDQCGTAKKLVCPYHAWTYDTAGRLLAARHLEPTVEKSDFGLVGCRVREVQGLIFISLADDPPPFDHIAADIDRFYQPHQLPSAKIAFQMNHVMQANWKIVAENFWECYHCGPAHPELAQVMSYVRAFDSKSAAKERADYAERWKDNTRRLGRITEAVENGDGVCHQVHRVPIREGFVTQSRDGKPVAPLLGEYKEYDGAVTSIEFFPLIWLVCANDYAMLTRFTPISVLETEAQATWLVRGDAVEGRDYNVDDVTWLWRKTLEEDFTITENNQKGVCSRRYQPGPYSQMEKPLAKLMSWYLHQIT
jgi:phenylpropionate dioxygenase-like ring-hydroxylating dioxygenase large terminal subunit